MSLLRVEDLAVEYDTSSGPVRAVDGVSFGIEGAGEALGIIGESGSGKSSLANALMRVLPRNGRMAGGRVYLDERDVAAMLDAHLKHRLDACGLDNVRNRPQVAPRQRARHADGPDCAGSAP